MRGLDPTLPTLPQLPSASRVRGAYLVLPPAPFRGRSPPASPTSTPVFDCVIYSQRDGTRSWQLRRGLSAPRTQPVDGDVEQERFLRGWRQQTPVKV